MTKEQLFEILDSNGVRYDKKIDKERTEGFVNDECAAYAEKVYADLYQLALYGVANGFNKCDDDIAELIKLIVSLIAGISRKDVNLAKTEAKRQQIMKDATYLRREINMDMVNQLLSNVDACIAAAESIISIRTDNAALCAKLGESKETLEKIKEALSHVADGSSKNAAEYQVNIFEALMDWREAVSRYNCYSDTVDKLKGALRDAEEWQHLTATVKKNAKAGVDYYEYKDDYDDISYIISAAKYAERTGGLREHLADFNKQTVTFYGVEALQDELSKMQADFLAERESLNARLAEVKKETDEVLSAYQNGEMDPVVADTRVASLDDEAADLEERLANAQEDFNYDSQDLKLKIRDAQDGSRIRKKIADNFEKFVNKIEAYRNTDPAMFVMLCSRIDFNGVYDTLTGRLTDKDIDEVYVSVWTVINETEEDIKRQRKNLSGFNAINDKVRESHRREERILREQEAERRQRLKGQTSVGGRVPVANSEEEAKKRLEGRLARRNGAVPVVPDENTNGNGSLNIKNDDK